MLIGNGWDLHKHSSSEILYLAGLKFEESGFEAYSDGDIILHALCDALLGSVGKKDLGHYFPSKQPTKKDIRSTFAFLSARVGSITDNNLGGWYSYRSSKTALNQIIKNFSIEIKRSNPNAIFVGLQPGTVKSFLSKPFEKNVKADKLFTPDYSAKKLLKVIDNLKSKDSGKIFAWDGEEILP